MGHMTGAAALLDRGMDIRSGKQPIIVTCKADLLRFRKEEPCIIAIMHRMAGTAAAFGKRGMNRFFLRLGANLTMTSAAQTGFLLPELGAANQSMPHMASLAAVFLYRLMHHTSIKSRRHIHMAIDTIFANSLVHRLLLRRRTGQQTKQQKKQDRRAAQLCSLCKHFLIHQFKGLPFMIN